MSSGRGPVGGLVLARLGPAPWRPYLELCKPRVVVLLVFTAVVGMLLLAPGPVPGALLLATALGIGLAAAAGAVLNHVADQYVDSLMERTRGRPLPGERLTRAQALVFALGLAVPAMVILVGWVNPLTALLTASSMLGYAVVYTLFLKRATPYNIVLGGAAGAAPPVLGGTAVSGQVSPEALVLFLIIFLWTPPHFWPLAIRRRAEYARAGIPMLPVIHGVAHTKAQILIYTGLLVAATLLPYAIDMSGIAYLAGAMLLGAGFLYYSAVLYRSPGEGAAMRTFAYSIFYLGALFALLLADRYLAG